MLKKTASSLLLTAIGFFGSSTLLPAQRQQNIAFQKIDGTKPKNVIFILSDDHRYDFMGFTGAVPGLKTPNMDRLAKEGVVFQNAFVTTSLCSPSRASILTGQYVHTHTVVDNQAPEPANMVFFPQYLQKQGYQTAFFGKWHMGASSDDPRPGFDRWVSFRGQGIYYNPLLNIDGKHVQYGDSSYITDVLTDLALDWLDKRDQAKPFFLYLSHKAVHAEFLPSRRDKGRYKDLQVQYPVSMFNTAGPDSKQFTVGKPSESQSTVNYRDIPQWVRARRYSSSGVDFMFGGVYSKRDVDFRFQGPTDFDRFYRDYLETLSGIDNSLGRVLAYLDKSGLDKETVIIYGSDNGFAFGEHGLIDKRDAYEASIRIPLMARWPGMIKPDTKVGQVVLNIDIAPTILEIAGVRKPAQMQGSSFLPLMRGESVPWRDRVFYEYYWEDGFPQTPTQFAVRTDRYKFIRSQGIWDINQLFDLQQDPYEMNNLIRSPQHQELAGQLNKELWDWLERTNGLRIPLKRIDGKKTDHLYRNTW